MASPIITAALRQNRFSEGLGAGRVLILRQCRAGGNKRQECQIPQAEGLWNSRDTRMR